MNITTEDVNETEKCQTSEESILMLLGRAPLKLSIKEISSITKWHRNTIRAQLSELKNDHKIKFHGDGNHAVYYTQSIIDHYRQISKTLYESVTVAGLSEEARLDVLRQFGKNLVRNSLEAVFGENTKFHHKNLLDVFAHFKMSYPFNDIESCCNTVNFIPGEISFSQSAYSNLPDFEITFQINPCLCKGDSNYFYACSMVEGALESALELIGGYFPIVRKIVDSPNEYCTYYINTDSANSMNS